MSAHIVRSEIPRDSPVLRVLFHTGTDSGSRRHILLTRHHQVCIVLHATMTSYPSLSAACSPDGEDGVCLAQITIPSNWWPPLPTPDKDGRLGKITKTPPKLVQVAYSVQEPRPDEDGCQPQMQLQPSTVLGLVPLVPARAAYKELQLIDALRILVPHPPLFPLSQMHIPVFLEREKSKSISAVVIRGKVKSGVRLLGATASDPSSWNITVEMNPRHTGAMVTAMRKEPLEPPSQDAPSTTSSQGEVFELFTWLVEITEDAAEPYEDAKIVWSARYEPHQDESAGGGAAGGTNEPHRMGGTKSATRLDIQKDDIQAVVPISKNWEVLNTAVLTGRQVSQAMKVFIVSQAGKAADVTFQASCHSEDDSVLKISSSCSSVYVDGSEARGSVNGSVLVKYGTYTGLARFTVWMPEFPLDLQVPDTRLSQLKSWKVPDYQPSSVKARRRKRSYGSSFRTGSIPDDMGNIVDRPNCRLRYQQSSVDVYAHFMASDHDSGRTSYLINRRTWLRVTDLVLPLLRVSDPRIASLHGRVLQGRSVGRTEVQVLSPITGRVIGAKEVRVGNDKVGLSRLSVQVVSGLQLNISPDSSIENGYVAETSVTRKLTAQYQEGLLDIELEFSDGSKTPLREVVDTDYHLVVESLDPEVVAFAPMVASHHPRVIAVGEGSGDLLQVTLMLSEECRAAARSKSKGGPLAMASASVVVDFSSSDIPHRPDILQNDGGSFSGGKGREFSDLQDILKDDGRIEPNVQARQYQGTKGSSRHQPAMLMTPLEISMYVLLAAFCFAIVVFVVSCVVYASKFKPSDVAIEGLKATPISTAGVGFNQRKPRETTTNAHDWVWLGRATLEPSSNRNSAVINNNTNEMRITTNPLNMNYCDPDDCVATSFSNPTHIELPSKPAESRIVDSSTYCKSKAGGRTTSVSVDITGIETADDELEVCLGNSPIHMQQLPRNKPTPPPPLPPHGLPSPDISMAEEYKPPVPPHRNIGVTTAQNDGSPRKHHHHHHHRNSKQVKESPKIIAEDIIDSNQRSVFEFDDEPAHPPRNNTPSDGVVFRQKPVSDDDVIQFVQYPKSPTNGNNRNSAEVKRATIVGNPMFSADDNQGEETAADIAGLDGLQLDMDYDQIMHYFDNLKESNA
ncbi:PREDICTED: transmembrane protein 132D isoform X2 [Nicrophorus vespilloides]|uniref:Transmembrane protein 132D isoform X2 n=1 Tax=Nicrophorus vespilloides TaxID=110193 RepID=A0ABM1M0H9_NICVS|nr:PREDICTED: transmembrane protein 132D isoform X2 [Nicrophorus vespilloides]